MPWQLNPKSGTCFIKKKKSQLPGLKLWEPRPGLGIEKYTVYVLRVTEWQHSKGH